MKRILISIAIAAVVLVGGFFLLNHYIYQEKQADAPDISSAPAEQPTGQPTFSWSYRGFENADIPYTEISLTASYADGAPVTKVIETVEGNCNVYEEGDTDVYERSEMIICYYAGFGRYYKVVQNGEKYLVQRKEFEEASPDYNPPVDIYRTLQTF